MITPPEPSPPAVALRAERRRQGLTQQEVGDRCGLSLQSISVWELGIRRPRLDSLLAWADALGCDVQIVVRQRGVMS